MGKTSIAIDGPAPSGKSTAAKTLAKQLSYVYCDTGAMYRVITYLASQNQIGIQAEEPLITLCVNHTIFFQQAENGQRVFIDGHEVTEATRQPDVADAASAVSKHAEVREEMVALQQKVSQTSEVVMDGRDIGIAVLLKAEVEIFLVASVEERAERRFKENQEKGAETDFETLKAEIERRNYLDSTGEVPSLVQVSDTVKIDATGSTIEEVVAAIRNVVKQKGFKLF